MKVILISNFYDIPGEHYMLNLLFCEGLKCFHLRKKEYTQQQMEAYIERIPQVFRRYIVLHSHFDLVNKYGLKGAHFTKQYSYEDYMREHTTSGSAFPQISFSLHNIQEVKNLEHSYKYIFLSPVFDSISNTGYNSRFRINDLKMFLNSKEERPEVIALSGITVHKIPNIYELGFDGFALLGYIWTYFNDTQNVIRTADRFKEVLKVVKEEKARLGVE